MRKDFLHPPTRSCLDSPYRQDLSPSLLLADISPEALPLGHLRHRRNSYHVPSKQLVCSHLPVSTNPWILAAPNGPASVHSPGRLLHCAWEFEPCVGFDRCLDAAPNATKAAIATASEIWVGDFVPPRRIVSGSYDRWCPGWTSSSKTQPISLTSTRACAIALARVIVLQQVNPKDITCMFR